jgi:hypothetical protein
MPLPKIEHPIYELTLPSTGKRVSFRPFLVKEEKILLMAKQGGDEKEIIKSLKQVINNCIVDSDVDVETFATFDIEYFFLKLRSRSVNNIVSLSYKDYEDEKIYTVDVDLEDVEMVRDPKHTNKIKINGQIGVVMKYPSIDVFNKLSSQEEDDAAFEVIKKCIDVVYDTDNVYNAKDFSEKEIEEFVQNLDVNSLEKILEFFKTMPRLHYEVKYTNSLNHERVVPLDTLTDFFTLG